MHSHFKSSQFFIGFQEKDKDKVNLIDVNPEALKTLLDYAYTTEVVVHEANVQDLLATSDLLQMTDVKDACCEFLKMQVMFFRYDVKTTASTPLMVNSFLSTL